MAPVSDEKRPSFSRKVRDILLPRPRDVPATPSMSHPSRLPTRQKRAYTEVDTNDAADLAHRSSVATTRGARVRQRTDSNASIVTLRQAGTSKSLELERTTSRDSVLTITPDSLSSSSVRASTPKHKRNASVIPVSSTSAGTSRTALTRTSSHNRLQDANKPTSSKDSIDFPAKKSASIFPGKMFSMKPAATPKPALEDAAPKSKSAKPLQRSSSSMMSIVLTDSEGSGSSASRSGSAPSRALARSSSSMMSITSDTNPPPSRIPIASRTRTPSLVSADEQSSVQDALDRMLAQEIEGEDDGADFRNMLASAAASRARSASVNSKASQSSKSSARSFVSACKKNMSLAKGWKKGRFDLKVEPFERHLTVWDVKNSDILAWCGSLAVVDTLTSPDSSLPEYDYPPIEELQIEFSSIGDTPAPPSPPSSPSSASRPRASSDASSTFSVRPEFTATYSGTVLKSKYPVELKQVHPGAGICLEPSWEWGYIQTANSHLPSSSSTSLPSLTPAKPTYMLRFYVPLPMSLFERCEYRRFRVKSRVVFGARKSGLSPLMAHSDAVDVAVEHLRKEIHMDGRKPLLELPTPPCSSP